MPHKKSRAEGRKGSMSSKSQSIAGSVPFPSIKYVLFSFEGRIDRSTYWRRGLLPLAGLFIMQFVFLRVVGAQLLALPITVLFMWMWLAILTKRCHDLNKSGWWSLIIAVIAMAFFGVAYFLESSPVVQVSAVIMWWIALIVPGFLEGTDGPNQYGPKSGEVSEDHSVNPMAASQNPAQVTTQGRIVFTGHFLGHFVISILLFLLTIITFGLALPYFFYWNFKYFFRHMEVAIPQPNVSSDSQGRRVQEQRGRIVFTGHFLGHLVISILLVLLSIITFGLALPYLFYWNFKYFFTRMELELPQPVMPQPSVSSGSQSGMSSGSQGRRVREQRGRIVFTGHFLGHFVISILLFLLTIITFGLALPYFFYWNFKYFFTHMEVAIPQPNVSSDSQGRRVREQRGRIVFTGHFLGHLVISILLVLLSIITFGLALPYLFYWNFKYFFTHMELELPQPVMPQPSVSSGSQSGMSSGSQGCGEELELPPAGRV